MIGNKFDVETTELGEDLKDLASRQIVAERIRLEMAFRDRGMAVATVSNLMLVRFPEFCTGIWLESSTGSGITANIQTFLGTLLGGKTGRRLAVEDFASRGEHRVELAGDDGEMIRVIWQARMASPIDVEAVCRAYEKHVLVVYRVMRVAVDKGHLLTTG